MERLQWLAFDSPVRELRWGAIYVCAAWFVVLRLVAYLALLLGREKR